MFGHGERGMLRTKLNLVAPFALAALGAIGALVEPAFAGTSVPAPIIGAGLPALAILGGGYWLIRKLREHR
jgi:lipopolysaccharide export LptBFGC system permease protein LptF